MPSVSSLEEASRYLASATRVEIGRDLTTEGLNRMLEHEAGDLTCTVEAGMRLSVLNARLAIAGQRLSLDPPGDPTVGGCIAANLSGPRRHRFGSPRDLVLGVTVVLADGTIASSGGKVVKNVAGYDLGKLFCGSRGSLGLIARVSLRLHPLPRSAATLVVETSDAAAVVRVLAASQLVPSAVDVLHPGRVAVLFEGGERAVTAQLAAAQALVGGREAGEETWLEARRRQGEAQGVVRFEPGRLGETLAGLGEAVVRPSAGVAYVPEPVEEPLDAGVARLNAAVKERFDPQGVLL